MISMTLRVSRLMLMTHITFSVGWIGAVAAFLALAIAGITGNQPMVRGCYIAMEVIAWFVIVPFCIASLITGIVQALVTPWGLFRHYWVVVKLVLTLLSTVLLLLHMQPISHVGLLASQMVLEHDQLRDLRIQLIADAGAAIFVLLVITTVSVYKPWGTIDLGVSLPRFKATTKRPMGLYLFIGLIMLLVLFILLHLLGGGMHQ
jgi:hypothetical protein